MATKRGYTTVEALAGEWILDQDLRGKIEEETVYRWIHTRTEEIIDTEQLEFAVSLVDIRDFKGRVPDGLHTIYLAAAVDDVSKCWNREQFVGYTQKVYGTDCEIEVNLKCPECNSSACSCSTPVMDIRVDDIYMQQRPYLWMMTTHGYLGYSAATTDGFPCANFSPDYKLMKPRPANDALWNSEYFLGVCSAIPGEVNFYSYEIKDGVFLTDMKAGQVYLAYLKHLKDSNGYLLIPDKPVMIQAILAYLNEKWMWRKWMTQTGNQNDRLRWLDARNESMQAMRAAKGELEMPDPDVWRGLLEKHWILPRDRFYY